METEQKQAKELLWGKTKELLLPSGGRVVIREQNGNDDDILSSQQGIGDLSNQSTFIQGIVISADWLDNKPLSHDGVQNLLLKDKYFILFASRIHSLGNEIKFKYDWGKDKGGEQEYIDDLNDYIWDFSEEIPVKGEDNYNEYRMEPYTANAKEPQVLVLESGKELAFDCLRVKDEKALLKIDKSKLTKNRELIQRNIRQKQKDGTYQKINNFRFFNKREMIEIHKQVNIIDTPFMPLTEIVNTYNNNSIFYPIISSSDFFFPEEI